ncbi:hypothetical protein CC86DRAFT_402859 [Ophiobolus disseminans]|uniref:Uncharacterized protein n=1 Tax=Ophiobolus disseminans TaxID=1469910 RepID=A0A6A7ADB5_9PLEO|nr:hypothetical protein CC86DRAFT_402859 [Ophiobolus disseminans]
MSASDPRPSSSIFPGNHPPDDHDEDGTVFNYYFLFLAAFLVLFGLLGWWLHRRRKQRKAQMQQSRQHALARDLEGWAGTHRYVQGGHASHQAGHVQRQDGLDEHGEAPPPYQPKSEVTVAHTPTGGYHHQSSSPAVPLRTLSRNELGRGRPPGYSATVDTHDSQSPRP